MSHTVSKEFRHQAYEAMTAEGLAVHLDTFFECSYKAHMDSSYGIKDGNFM